MSDMNPYAAPKAELVQNDADAERVRRGYLQTESHLKAVGVLIVFGGILVTAGQWMMGRALAAEFGVMRLSPSIFAVLLLTFAAGGGLCALKPWAWKTACLGTGLLMMLGFVRFPRGLADLLIHAVVLRFLLSRKSRRVFEPAYQEIMRKTPLMRSPPARWVFVLMTVVTVLLALAYVLIQL